MTESHVLPPDQGESMEAGRPYTKFVRRLESILALSDQDVRLLSEMPTTVRSYRSDQDIVREADMPSQCCLLLDGFLYRHKIANGSTRQIMSFHVPGDIPDLHSLHLDRMDHNLTSLGPTGRRIHSACLLPGNIASIATIDARTLAGNFG